MAAATKTITRAPLAPMDIVEWRPQGKPNDGRCQWVAYLDAAAVASLMDEWVGPVGWRDSYEPVRDSAGKAIAMWCTVEVRDPATGEWVGKTDVGTPSDMEAAKGIVSDAFKRAACLKWGAGRNVYDLPVVWAPCKVNARGHAYPAPNTLSTILAECRKLGHEIDGGRVQAATPETSSNGASDSSGSAPPAGLDDGKRQLLADLYEQVPAGTTDKSLDDLVTYASLSDAHFQATVDRLEKAAAAPVDEGDAEEPPF